VSPSLLQKYREGLINLDLLQAFTLTDDHATQEEVWEQLQPWDRKAQTIRRMLSHNEIPASDKLVRFVGVARYEAEGGTVRRDLFAAGEDGTYIVDTALLTRLVNATLQLIADGLQGGGWKWVLIQPEIDHAFVSRHRRLNAPILPFTAEAEAQLQTLQQQRDAIEERFSQESDEDDDRDGEDDELVEQADQLDEQMRLIRLHREYHFSAEMKASSGVVVGVGNDGQPHLIQGLLRKEDEAALAKTAQPDDAGCHDAQLPDEIAEDAPTYSAALVESLTQYKTAAIAIELSRQPLMALAALVHGLILNEFGLDLQLYRERSSIQISSRQADLRGASDSTAVSSLDLMRINWAKVFPNTAPALWDWCLQQPQDKLLELVAYCVARTVHGVESKNDNDPQRLQHADTLARALDFDMTKWFTPTASNFFSRVSKSQIADALAEAGKPVNADGLKLKKAELAGKAELSITGTRWLPEPRRISSPDQ
jgi:ParB family chromosome partitioning protein